MEGQAVKCQLARELIHYLPVHGTQRHTPLQLPPLLHHCTAPSSFLSPLRPAHAYSTRTRISLVRGNLSQSTCRRGSPIRPLTRAAVGAGLHATPRSLQKTTSSRTIAGSQTAKDRQQYCDGVCSLGN
jgi:hypothetical protein